METNGFFIANALKTDENFNILIVDDDLVILEILKKTLESVTNFNIFTADNPGLALDLVKNNDIDLSITDCFLPLINGLELIKNINDIKPDIPSIMISGSVDPEIIVKSINSNMVFGFLKKPVKDKELISMVYKALEIKILKRENKKYKRELEEKNIILEENKFRLCSILLNITDGVLILFPDGKIDLMNAKIQRLFFGRENSCYNIYSIYEISGFDSLKNKIRNFIDGKEENLRFEEDISDDIYSIHLSKFRNNGKLIGISVIFIDVTKEKEVDKLKMEFIANISHELKTPLASIQGFTEILLKAPNLQAEKREEFLNIVFKEALRLSKMVNSILDFSKIEFEKEVPKFENVD
ncbi:MAG TPA: response regulator, partial [Spirochaetota bacterium]|nr:response regulator [Spirochaetota bacterium]